jgi:hypothetical protein
LIRRIRELLYEEGFTISGARIRLEEQGGATVDVSDAGSIRADLLAVLHILSS